MTSPSQECFLDFALSEIQSNPYFFHALKSLTNFKQTRIIHKFHSLVKSFQATCPTILHEAITRVPSTRYIGQSNLFFLLFKTNISIRRLFSAWSRSFLLLYIEHLWCSVPNFRSWITHPLLRPHFTRQQKRRPYNF